MTEYENSKSDDQLEELLLLTEQMQDELEQKDRTIRELKMQLDESLTLKAHAGRAWSFCPERSWHRPDPRCNCLFLGCGHSHAQYQGLRRYRRGID